MNLKLHSQSTFVLLTTVAKNKAQAQETFYGKMPMRYYADNTEQFNGQQKLLDHGFQELYEKLDLANAQTDFAKIAKFVLEQNIGVSKDNVEHSDIKHYIGGTVGGPLYKKYKNEYGFKVGKFTKGDDEIIKENWPN